MTKKKIDGWICSNMMMKCYSRFLGVESCIFSEENRSWYYSASTNGEENLYDDSESMSAFIIRRLLLAIPVLWIVVSLTFLLMRLAPGNPFSTERAIPESVLRALEARYKLNGTPWQQYTNYLGDLIHGDLGLSTKYRNRTVNEILAQTLPVSFLLGGLAFVLAMMLGIFLGCFAAVHHNEKRDRLAMLAALIGISVPNFVLAPLLILLLCMEVRLLPVAGWGSWSQIILPALCLALPFAASVARLMRSSMLDVLGLDFIRTARAKGLPERTVLFRHALKVAILPLVSYAGPLAATVVTGSIVIEQIFRIPGMGHFFVNSVLDRDLFMVGGTVLVYSLFLILFNLCVDMAYFILDRRIRLG
jgi:ABC-type dipeptide/oligopeptide/nickel transport system permease component